MLILDHHEPYIKTTPDECVPFVLLERGSAAYNKFVMENFISFRLYEYQDEVPGYYYLRFENYLYWDTFEGFDSFTVPTDVLGSCGAWLPLLVTTLRKGYLVLTYVNEKYIPFYNCTKDTSHRMVLYGVDTEAGQFFCQDFVGGVYLTFQVSFTEMAASMEHYAWETLERNGMFALRVSSGEKRVSYRKLYQGLGSLLAAAENRDTFEDGVYGLAALRYNLKRFVLGDMESGKIMVGYMWLNFVRDSCKLMQDRLHIMADVDGHAVSSGTREMFGRLKRNADTSFFRMMKWEAGEKYTVADTTRLARNMEDILQSYTYFAEGFRADVGRVL